MARPSSSRDTSETQSIRAISARFDDKPDALLEILHAVQDEHGFVPAQATDELASALNISRAEVHGVVTFYHDYRRDKAGRHTVKVCRAESCQAMGCRTLEGIAKATLGIGYHETTADQRVSLDPVYCFGNCAMSPTVMIDGELHGRVTPAKLNAMLAELA